MLPPFGGALGKPLTLLDLRCHWSDVCLSGELVG